MINEPDRCPRCEATAIMKNIEESSVCLVCGYVWTPVESEARAGVSCAALVGASDSASEEPEGWCNPCGTPRGEKCWGHCIGTRIVGTNDIEPVAPTSVSPTSHSDIKTTQTL